MITGPIFSLVVAALLVAATAAAARWPTTIVSWPRSILALLAAITVGALGAIVQLEPVGLTIGVNPASEPLLPLSDPGRDVYRQATLDFGNDDIYVVAMQTESGVFTSENLQALRRITDSIRKLPGVRDAESLTHTDLVWWKDDPGWVEVSEFISEIPEDEALLDALRKRALAHPIYPKTIVAKDARTAAINVTFQPMTDAEFVELDLDGEIHRLVEHESHDGRRFYIAGRPHVRAQAYHTMVGDIVRLVPIAILMAAATLWLMTGSLRGMLVPLLSCLTATLWSFGAMAALNMDLNLVTLVLAPMLICVGSVYGVHVVARFETIAANAQDARQAALDCLTYTRAPVVMAGVTTCIGYGALQLADIQATNELGAFSVLGVASVTLLTLTGVPAALSLLPLERGADETGAPLYASRTRVSAWVGKRIDALLNAMATLVTQRSGSVLLVWALVAGAALLLIPRIVIDTDVLTFFREDSRVRTDFAAVNERLTGAVPIYVVFNGEEEGTFRKPESLRALERVQLRLEALPGVSEVLSSTDLVKMTHQAMAGGGPEHARIPETRAAIAETVFMLPKSRLSRFANSNHSRANLVVRTGRSGSAAILALEADIRRALVESDLPQDLRAEVTGNAILINRSADGIAGNQGTQMGFAAGTILLMVSVLFGSLRVGSLSMIPNIVPVIVFFGVLGAGVASLSVPTSLIGSIALGIAIDDTVHFLVAYQRGRAAGGDPLGVATHCMRQVGRPIVMTTVMLVVGFLVMLLSGFATLQEFGYLTALTMLICLLADLLLLPALLVRLRV